MMASLAVKIQFNDKVLSEDFPRIRAYLKNDNLYNDCLKRIDLEINKICKNHQQNGTICIYEPLASQGWKKYKFYSSKVLQNEKGIKTDMRLIFRYNESNNELYILAVGFRIKQMPRPIEDPYSQAEIRVLEFEE